MVFWEEYKTSKVGHLVTQEVPWLHRAPWLLHLWTEFWLPIPKERQLKSETERLKALHQQIEVPVQNVSRIKLEFWVLANCPLKQSYVLYIYIWLKVKNIYIILNEKIWTSFHVDMSLRPTSNILWTNWFITHLSDNSLMQWLCYQKANQGIISIIFSKSFIASSFHAHIYTPRKLNSEFTLEYGRWDWKTIDLLSFWVSVTNFQGRSGGCSTSGFGVPEISGRNPQSSRSFSRLRWLDRVRRGAFARRSPPWQMNVTSWRFFSASPCPRNMETLLSFVVGKSSFCFSKIDKMSRNPPNYVNSLIFIHHSIRFKTTLG